MGCARFVHDSSRLVANESLSSEAGGKACAFGSSSRCQTTVTEVTVIKATPSNGSTFSDKHGDSSQVGKSKAAVL